MHRSAMRFHAWDSSKAYQWAFCPLGRLLGSIGFSIINMGTSYSEFYIEIICDWVVARR